MEKIANKYSNLKSKIPIQANKMKQCQVLLKRMTKDEIDGAFKEKNDRRPPQIVWKRLRNRDCFENTINPPKRRKYTKIERKTPNKGIYI